MPQTDAELFASIIKQIEVHKGIDVEVIDFKTGERRIPKPHSFNWRVATRETLRKLLDELG